MKVKVYGDEYYPFYQPDQNSFAEEVELTEDEFKKWQKSLKETDKWNSLIGARIKEAQEKKKAK